MQTMSGGRRPCADSSRLEHFFRAFLCALCVSAVNSVSAGDLAPPVGPVAPTMKTLQQVEPRIPINSTNTPGDAGSLFKITQPGSYYLTGNITGEAGKHGIEIAAIGVTIDLMGFVLLGVPGSLNGIHSPGFILTTVRNGHVYTWGGDGVRLAGNSVVVEGINAVTNGGWGIFLNVSFPGSRISGCCAGQNTLGGISAAQAGLVERCAVYFHPSAPGIVGSSATRIEHCVLWNCNPGIQFGFSFGSGGAFDNSMFACPVGIVASGTNTRIERNIISTTQASHVGLRATASGNDFIDNVVYGSGDHYDFVAGNRLRLILSKVPESIDWPAHVTLAGTLFGTSGQHGITVNADDVTIDLGGHTLQGVGGSFDGITANGSRRNTAVRNGKVVGWANDGVDLGNASNATVTDLHSSNNSGIGIVVGTHGAVRDCTAASNGSDNIRLDYGGRAERCIASSSTGGHGINAAFTQCSVTDCTANSNSQSGIRVSQRGQVLRCTASDNILHGVHITFGGVVEGCFLQSNDTSGILMDAGGGVHIHGNTISESVQGIRIINAGACRVEDNTVTGCTTAYDIQNAGNFIRGNSAASSTTAYSIVGGNTAGPVITSGTIGTATNPYANISH